MKAGRPGKETEPPRSVFDSDWIVMADAGGDAPPLTACALVARAVRDLLMGSWDGPVPEVVSGHAADGSPSRLPHAAVLPLAFVAAPGADGRLLGLALALPMEVAGGEPARRALAARAAAILTPAGGAPLALTLGRRGVWRVERRLPPFGFSLDPARYQGPARTWASITPVVLDHFPKGELSPQAVVAAASANIGLPRPRKGDIALSRLSSVAGAPAAWADAGPWGTGGWTLPARRDGSRHPLEGRLATHAVIEYPEAVLGPVVLGAGRFLGLGLCMPLPERGG